MEIKTTIEIRLESSVKISEAIMQESVDLIDNKKWIAFDDMINRLNEVGIALLINELEKSASYLKQEFKE